MPVNHFGGPRPLPLLDVNHTKTTKIVKKIVNIIFSSMDIIFIKL